MNIDKKEREMNATLSYQQVPKGKCIFCDKIVKKDDCICKACYKKIPFKYKKRIYDYSTILSLCGCYILIPLLSACDIKGAYSNFINEKYLLSALLFFTMIFLIHSGCKLNNNTLEMLHLKKQAMGAAFAYAIHITQTIEKDLDSLNKATNKAINKDPSSLDDIKKKNDE